MICFNIKIKKKSFRLVECLRGLVMYYIDLDSQVTGLKQCKFVKNCLLLGGMEVLVCSDSICMRETTSLIGIKQVWLIVKAEVIHETTCGAWALNSAVDTRSSPYSEDFRHVGDDVMGKHITLLTLFCLLCACAKSLCFRGIH